MTEAFIFLIDSFHSFLVMLSTRCVFTFFGVTINYLQVLVALIIIGLITSVFWKGART